MFHVRRVHDTVLPVNRAALEACGRILLEQIPTATAASVERMEAALHNPVAGRFKAVLLVAERRHRVRGFAMLLHEPQLRFSYLEFICAEAGRTSSGLGSALYERTREEAASTGARVLFLEVSPDDPAWCPDAKTLQQNRARLRFYENWGARPVLGTQWDGGRAEAAPASGQAGLATKHDPADPLTYLVADPLGRGDELDRRTFRRMLETLLERRYADEVSAADREAIGATLRTPRMTLRPFRYAEDPGTRPADPRTGPISMVVTQDHYRHWVHDRGYYEAPVRIRSITDALRPSGLVRELPVKAWPNRHLRSTHDADYLKLIEQLSTAMGDESTYADVFPPRKRRLPPADPISAVGWFCSDSFTPLSAASIAAARHAVDCTLTAAAAVLGGCHLAYSLVRPPGHHAESRLFGGYCYFNNCAIAANHLVRELGRVAILDIDYHHGNGQQEIFFRRSDVLTVSVHGDPRSNYPYFAGYADECGIGGGKGFNLNLPLPSGTDGPTWRERGLAPALARIAEFAPACLVLAAGLDTAKADPTGTFTLGADDFLLAGRTIGALGLPTLIVQEGGYRTRTLGRNVVALLRGIAQGAGLV